MADEDKVELKNIGIPVGLAATFKTFCKGTGRVQFVALAQLMEWFLEQPPAVKAAILGESIEGLEKHHGELLRALADKVDPPVSTIRQAIEEAPGQSGGTPAGGPPKARPPVEKR